MADEKNTEAQTADEEVLQAEIADDEVEISEESDGSDAVASEEEAEDQPELDLAQQLAEAQDRYARLQAEWDNYRKRTASERAQERQRATERLVTNLLPVVDDMERAIASGDSTDDPMLAGVKAVYDKLVDVLGREGLQAVDPQPGDEFDINMHQAVSSVEDTSMFDESIQQVYQKGYTMGDKILRSAMVVVSTGGPARVAKEKQD